MRLFVYLIPLLLTACETVATLIPETDELADQYRTSYCNNPAARASAKISLDARARAEDYAVCLRCPGEAQISCAGDPKSLPEAVSPSSD